MEVAALVISMLAFAASGWAAWATHRGAKASESAVETAREALSLGRVADERDASRQRVESASKFVVENAKQRTRARGVKIVTVTCQGVLAYDRVSATLDMTDPMTVELARGFDRDSEPASTSELGAMQVGESRDLTIVRANPEKRGDIKILLTARHGPDKWTSVHYVKVAPPPRVYSI